MEVLDEILRRCVEPGTQISLSIEDDSARCSVNLFGDGCERTVRTTGQTTEVAPLVCLGSKSELWAWIGFREEWERGRNARNPQKLSFRHIGLVIYFGRRHAARKVQIFRAEWSGAALSDEAPEDVRRDIGDPHWQFDGMESMFRVDAELHEARLRVQQLGSASAVARPFGPREPTSNELHALVSRRRVSRLHFPSAAAWWRPAPDDAHTHTPKSAKEVEVWVDKTVSYIGKELVRLQGGW